MGSTAHLYNFGMSQEDERTECAALDIDSDARVLSICSAGDMPLSLLALGAGLVVAIDIDEAQLHLAALKGAAVRELQREQAICFLGYLPAGEEERIRCYHQVAPALPTDARAYWYDRLPWVANGAIWAGRYERYVRKLVGVLNPLLGRRIRGLFECRSLVQQQEYFQRVFDRMWLRLVFELAFHPWIYSKRGMDPRSLAHRRSRQSVGQQFFERFRALCTQTPVADNYLLQLHLLGQVLTPNAVPAYLSETGSDTIRNRWHHLTFRRSDLITVLRNAEKGEFNRFHLSNLPDWMPQDGFDTVMDLLVDISAGQGRAVWRFLHVERPVPEALVGRIAVDRDFGSRLLERDRFPLYTIVPATVNG